MMRKWLVGAVLSLSVVGVAAAIDFGVFGGCDDCTLSSISGPEDSIFFRTVVNADPRVTSWVDSKGNPNTATICTATSCRKYEYIKLSGLWRGAGQIVPACSKISSVHCSTW